MGENNQKIKLLRIMEFLRSESEAGKPVSTNQIINYLKGHNTVSYTHLRAHETT